MKRSTVRLIHAIAYRRALAQDLPHLEAKLTELLRDGRELRTRRWRVTMEDGHVVLVPNESPKAFDQIPLALPRPRRTP